MKIEMNVEPRSFWVQKVEYMKNHPGYGKECEAKVTFEQVNGNDYAKYFYGSLEECVSFIREHFPNAK